MSYFPMRMAHDVYALFDHGSSSAKLDVGRVNKHECLYFQHSVACSLTTKKSINCEKLVRGSSKHRLSESLDAVHPGVTPVESQGIHTLTLPNYF